MLNYLIGSLFLKTLPIRFKMGDCPATFFHTAICS